MHYPEVLIPAPNYKLLRADEAPVAALSLLRWHDLPPEQFFDPVTGLPAQEEYIEKFTKNTKDVSTSLLGNFCPEHYSYRLRIGDENRRNYLVFEGWSPGQKVAEPPTPGEFIHQTPPTLYTLIIQDVNDHRFPFDFQGERFHATLKVRHTPCRSNYWHFSVRVEDDAGADIGNRYPHDSNKKLNKRDKAILKTARQVLQNQVRAEVPVFSELPPAVYAEGEG